MYNTLKSFLIAASIALTTQAAEASVTYTDLGTGSPPTSVQGIQMQSFSSTAQAAVADFSNVTTIPGSPISGSLTTSGNVNKRTVPTNWSTWSHSYTGPIFYVTGSSITLTLPAGAKAFYLYVEPNSGTVPITVTTNSTGNSGAVSVNSTSGARGFAFTASGETISTVTIAGAGGFGIGEFAIAADAAELATVPTLSEWALLLLGGMMVALAFGFQRRSF